MEKPITLLLSLLLLLGCKSKTVYLENNFINNSKIIDFACTENKTDCINQAYKLFKIYDSQTNFRIKHSDITIFKASEQDRTFIYEVYESNFLLIYDIPKPNNFASPHGYNKVFYICNLSTNVTYRFKIANYSLSPFKPTRQIHKSGTKSTAFINKINTDKLEVELLFYDLETVEKLGLEIMSY
ncbi:hypothetical protein [Flavobacterium sp.]|uniref:hypothetical protein n=1 Tax=Flavobacterium sp. TaxID=239 RepID=UPI0026327F18|nr:hypothetical protein [Flavobacterium sp.]